MRPPEAMFETFNQNGLRKWPSQERPHFQLDNRDETVEEPDPELEDDDEFEDKVIDRLSKLENSVNEMMREKKIKEELRGYVGAPIQFNKTMEGFEREGEDLPSYIEPPSDRTEER